MSPSYDNYLKLIRFIKIYRLKRSINKVLGRFRPNFKPWLILKFPFYNYGGKKVGLIGVWTPCIHIYCLFGIN